jgi:hypothetical protein
VRRAGPKRLREVRVVSPEALARLKDSLTVVVPQGPVKGAGVGGAGGAQGRRSGKSART